MGTILLMVLHSFSKKNIPKTVPMAAKTIRNESIKLFFDKPFEYYNNDTKWGKWLSKNINFFDFGFSNELELENDIDSKIDKIENIFSLIMISDYMDESLILLKHHLCLETEDILYFSINKR